MTREEFISEVLPSRAVQREILGYAWEVLVNGGTVQDSKCFVWPETCSGSGFPEWPEDLLAIKTDMGSGPFYGITEAPGRKGQWNEYIRLLIDRKLQWCIFNAINYSTDSEHGVAEIYDGFRNFEVIRPWIDLLLQNRIVPVINWLFQGNAGAPPTYSILHKYPANEYGSDREENNYKDKLGDWAKMVYDYCGGKVIFFAGFEDNEYPSNDRWGPGGLKIQIAALKSKLPNVKVFTHWLDGDLGPRPGDENYKPANELYPWLNADGVFYQYHLDGQADQYYVDDTIEKLKICNDIGIIFYGCEYVRPAADETRARKLGQSILKAGAKGVLNGC